MAPALPSQSASDPSSSIPRTPIPKNPTPLSASQEAAVRDLYYKKVRQKCAKEIEEFAKCALNRTISTTWACRPQNLAMNTCMVSHATREEQDEAREEWFAQKEVRRREREEKERKRLEQEKFHREWWGMDEKGRYVAGKGIAGEMLHKNDGEKGK